MFGKQCWPVSPGLKAYAATKLLLLYLSCTLIDENILILACMLVSEIFRPSAQNCTKRVAKKKCLTLYAILQLFFGH